MKGERVFSSSVFLDNTTKLEDKKKLTRKLKGLCISFFVLRLVAKNFRSSGPRHVICYKTEKLRGSFIPFLFSFIGITLRNSIHGKQTIINSCSSSLTRGWLVFALAAVRQLLLLRWQTSGSKVCSLLTTWFFRYCKNVNSCVKANRSFTMRVYLSTCLTCLLYGGTPLSECLLCWGDTFIWNDGWQVVGETLKATWEVLL